MSSESIKIRPSANHHGAFLIVVGLFFLFIIFITSSWLWTAWKLSVIAIIMCSIVAIITGVLKKLQPGYSFILTKQAIQFIHRCGTWSLNWNNISRISIPKAIYGIEEQKVPYIGIKLNNITPLAQNISVRLANRLIHEQKPLLIWAINHELLTFEETIMNFSPFRLDDSTLIKGPTAAFLHQMQVLEKAFGFHLFIPNTALDRELEAFRTLLIQCKCHAQIQSDQVQSSHVKQ